MFRASGPVRRYYVLLDYEHPNQWYHRIIANPRCGHCAGGVGPRCGAQPVPTGRVAKAITFCLRQPVGGRDADEPPP